MFKIPLRAQGLPVALWAPEFGSLRFYELFQLGMLFHSKMLKSGLGSWYKPVVLKLFLPVHPLQMPKVAADPFHSLLEIGNAHYEDKRALNVTKYEPRFYCVRSPGSSAQLRFRKT